jgi:glycosyltransferase involved in cell wall biosynthesis
MVGTVEPRKGHRQVLDAFHVLWSKGVDLQLVVVGSTGWVPAEFSEELTALDNASENFHWLNFVSDGMLQALYANASGTLMASLGEGFGLPLIEAARSGSALIARDLPVFREVCGNHAWYFSSEDGPGLAMELERWLSLRQAGTHPTPDGLTWIDWKESTRRLLDNIMRGHWYL